MRLCVLCMLCRRVAYAELFEHSVVAPPLPAPQRGEGAVLGCYGGYSAVVLSDLCCGVRHMLWWHRLCRVSI